MGTQDEGKIMSDQWKTYPDAMIRATARDAAVAQAIVELQRAFADVAAAILTPPVVTASPSHAADLTQRWIGKYVVAVNAAERPTHSGVITGIHHLRTSCEIEWENGIVSSLLPQTIVQEIVTEP
jgi:hypothetical protein